MSAWKITRDLHRNHSAVSLDAALERLCHDVIFRARLLLPRADRLRADNVAPFVAYRGLGREACHHRLDVVPVLRFEIVLEDDRKIEFNGRSTLAVWIAPELSLYLPDGKNTQKGRVLTHG